MAHFSLGLKSHPAAIEPSGNLETLFGDKEKEAAVGSFNF